MEDLLCLGCPLGLILVFLSDDSAIMFVIFGLWHAINVTMLNASLAFMLCYGCIPVCISCTYQENYHAMGVHVERKIIDGVHRVYLLIQDLGC